MAEGPSNSSGKVPKIQAEEATEAKLCAYLEDALPAAERAEIERYLQNNPQHRKLLAELATARKWLAALPRQNAPPDIAEAFQQQMERSMLLDDVPGSGGAVPLNPWPQRMLIAALVLLAAGLGLVVYLALPGAGGATPARLAGNVAPAGTQSAAMSRTAPAAMSAAPPAVAVVPTTGPAELQVAMAPQMSAVKAMAPMAAPVTQPSPGAMASAAGNNERMRSLELSAPPNASGNAATMITVATTQPAALTMRVRAFFDDNRIAYQPVDLANWTDEQQLRSGMDRMYAERAALNAASQPAATEMAFATSQPAQAGAGAVGAGQSPDMTSRINGATPSDETTIQALVARNVSAEVGTQLSTALMADYPGAELKVSNEHGQDGGSVIAKGQVLSVTVDQLTGPGVEKMNTLRVAEDGTITLPMMMEPVPAAGLTDAELSRTIAQRYREVNLIPDATVHVATAAAGTQPGAAGATTQALEANATSRPAATQASGGGRVDLFVLVQGMGAATQPSTMPAGR